MFVCFGVSVRMGNSLEQHRQVIGGFYSKACKIKKSRANYWEPWEDELDSWQVNLCNTDQLVSISWIWKHIMENWSLAGEHCEVHRRCDDVRSHRGGLFRHHQHDAVDNVWNWNKSWPKYLPNNWRHFEMAWKVAEGGEIVRGKAEKSSRDIFQWRNQRRQKSDQTLPEAQRTQGIVSLTWVISPAKN